jgi:hypothetical protein
MRINPDGLNRLIAKGKLFMVIRQLRRPGTSAHDYLNSDLPPRREDGDSVFVQNETALPPHDESYEGRRFKMRAS